MRSPLFITVNGESFAASAFAFPGGELQVRLPDLPFLRPSESPVLVTARIQSSDDLVQLVLATEVLARVLPDITRRLTIPYFPYARQDRVMQDWEAFSLRPVCAMVNALGYDRVTVLDPHSDVLPALLDRVDVVTQLDLIRGFHALADMLRGDERLVIVSPDAGAAKKALKVAQHFKRPLAVAGKEREIATGEILRTTLADPGAVQGRSCLIVDDICDGGRTFTELAKVLREAGATSIHLYVTHGIFSKGLGVFDGLIDAVFTTDSFIPSHAVEETQRVKLYRHTIINYQGA